MATVPASSQEVAARLDEQRRAVGETIDKLRARLKREMDWRRQLEEHTGVALTVAAATGLLVGRALRRL
ncbi:MAG: hypothetical protein ACRD2H_00265 [Terriglobales bacterium]